jgi:hypothetical protein
MAAGAGSVRSFPNVQIGTIVYSVPDWAGIVPRPGNRRKSMTEAKISISRICRNPNALEARRSELKAVLNSAEGVFCEEDRMRARQEAHALTECVHLLGESIHASLRADWEEAGCLLNRAYRRNGEEPPIESPIEAGYAFHRGTHPVQAQAG